MADGKGCTCSAWSESECGCDADWTPQEVYDLRRANAAVYGLLADIRNAVGDPTGRLMQDELISHCRSLHAEVGQLREAIRRLAEQDATLSVCGGAVTVTMDATLTDAEREALEDASGRYVEGITPKAKEYAATLRGLLERTK